MASDIKDTNIQPQKMVTDCPSVRLRVLISPLIGLFGEDDIRDIQSSTQTKRYSHNRKRATVAISAIKASSQTSVKLGGASHSPKTDNIDKFLGNSLL